MAKVVILTRGGDGWGFGHLYRSGWLADALNAHFGSPRAAQVFCMESKPAREFWRGREVEVTYFDPGPDFAGLGNALHSCGVNGGTAVVDWLDSPKPALSVLRDCGIKMVLLDDYGPCRSLADLVINSLLSPLGKDILHAGRGRVVSGIDFVQLPPAVTKIRNVATATARAMDTELVRAAHRSEAVHAILLSFGGGAQPEVLQTVLDALARQQFPGRVIAMPVPELDEIPAQLDLEVRPAGPDFHEILAAVDLAVLGGGLSLYEAACLGVPSLAVAIPSATPGYEDHQRDTIRKLAEVGICRGLGSAGDIDAAVVSRRLAEVIADHDLRGRMSAAGMKLIDGQGLQRTVNLIVAAVDCA